MNQPWMAPDAYAALDKMASPPRCADGVVPALPDAVARQKAERVNLRRQRTSTGCCLNFRRICPSIVFEASEQASFQVRQRAHVLTRAVYTQGGPTTLSTAAQAQCRCTQLRRH